jgi:glycine/serine hydroxymethyltransferase
VLEVGDGRGIEMAQRLEANGIICNYQATPTDEGFTTASGLRLGTAEMTRFGMDEEDFRQVAQLIRDVVTDDRKVGDEVARLRSRFTELRYCFAGPESSEGLRDLRDLI